MRDADGPGMYGRQGLQAEDKEKVRIDSILGIRSLDICKQVPHVREEMTKVDFEKLVSKYAAIPDEYYKGEEDLTTGLLRSGVGRSMEFWTLRVSSPAIQKRCPDEMF